MAPLLALALAAAPSPWPAGIDLPAGEAVDEAYRAAFDECDRAGTYRGVATRYTRGCPRDANVATALRRLPGGPIAYVAKLAVDYDGSALACGPNRGRMDQCPTSLMLDDGGGHEVPVDADAIPYVVIPEAGPGEQQGEFSRLTGVHVGDFGVVLWRGRTVPVIVADTGPSPKIGEGSLALHRALGHDQCTVRDRAGACVRVDGDMESIGGGVVTVLFPGSARPVTPATIGAVTRREGSRLWRDYRRGALAGARGLR